MSTNQRATMSKRQRELDQKDRVKMREARRAERRARSAERAASGQVGPPMGDPMPPIGDASAPHASTEVRRHLAEHFPATPSRAREEDMGTRLYVGNLSYDTNADAIRELFSELGEVTDVHVVMDRDTGRPRGFAFVTMGSQEEAEKAIRETNGKMVDGRSLRVNEAEDRPRGGGGGGGGPRGGGGGGRGGGGRGGGGGRW
jgi:uncharacterized membrane protein YgcG